MASGENLGAKFTIDVSDLQKGLSTANKLIKESESKFKAAAAGMDDWKSSADGLEAKLDSLTEIQEIQKEKVNAAQKAYDDLIDKGMNPASSQAIKLRTDINNFTAQLNTTNRQIQEAETALNEMSDAEDETGDKAKDAKKGVDDVGDSAENAGSKLDAATVAIGTFIGNGLTAIVDAAKNAVSALWGLPEATKEITVSMAKIETGFTTAGLTVDQASQTYSDFFAVLGDNDKTTEALGNLAQLADGQQDLTDWTTIATGVYATFGDGLPIEGLTEAANETAKVGTVTGSLADALNWVGLSEDEFNEQLAACNSEQERAQLITDTLTNKYSDAAATYRELNGDIMDANEAQADWTQTQAEFGEAIRPLQTEITKGLTGIIGKFTELAGSPDFSKITEAIGGAFSWFIDNGVPAIIDGVDWIKQKAEEIAKNPTVQRFAAMIKSAFDWFVQTGIPAIGTAISWIKDNVLPAVLPVIENFANNVMDIVEDIWAIIQRVVELIKPYMDELWAYIRAIWDFAATYFQAVWDSIALIFEVVKDVLSGDFSGAWDAIKQIVSTWADYFREQWQNIKNIFSAVVNFYKAIFTDAWNAIKNAFSPIVNWFSQKWESVKNIFKNVKTWFKNIFTGAWNAIKNVFANVGEFFGGIWDTIKEKFTTIGSAVGEAIGGAFKKAINAVLSTAENILNAPIKAINKILDKINEVISPNIPKLNTIDLPRLARGGIVDGATPLIAGEAGAEAIIPLENNTQWIRKVAAEMAQEFATANNENGAGQIVINQTNNYSSAHSRYEIYKSKQQTAAAVKLALLGV